MTPSAEVVDLGPRVRAFFTTRLGGVSRGEYGSLNLSSAVGDDPAAVRENRSRVARLAGGPVAFADQVHGADVAEVRAAPTDPLVPVARVDALVARAAAAAPALGVLVADCVPVLLADPVARVVATAHAGRAGVVADVVGAALAAMIVRGARTDRIRAAIGPAVCGRCYEVGEELRAQVTATVPIAHATTSWGTPALDLPGAVRHRLESAGLADLVVVERCTLEDEDLFSHRGWGRTGTRHGRQAGVVALS